MDISCPECGVGVLKQKWSGELECNKCHETFYSSKGKVPLNGVPSHCRACGGNYPECMNGCKLYK